MVWTDIFYVKRHICSRKLNHWAPSSLRKKLRGLKDVKEGKVVNTKWTRARVCRLCLTSRVAPLCLSTASDPHSENRFPMVAITHPSMVQTCIRAVQRAALCKGVPLSLKSRQPTHTHPPSWMTPHRNTHFCLLNSHIHRGGISSGGRAVGW